MNPFASQHDTLLDLPFTIYRDSPPGPLIVPADATIQEAMSACLARPVQHVYDPFVVAIAGEPNRLINFVELIKKQVGLLKRAQAVATSDNAQNIFLARMSHELKTPLTAIIGYSEILIEDFKSGQLDQAIPRLEKIVQAGVNLMETIDGILDSTKSKPRDDA